MSIQIVYPNGVGGLVVVNPQGGFTVEEVFAKDVPVEHHSAAFMIDASALPVKYFRRAWVAKDRTVVTDMAKAREIQRDRIRGLRGPALEALDRAFTRAQGRAAVLEGPRKEEAEETMRAVETQRQLLRDAPADPAIDAAKTPEELAAVMPEILKA